MTVAEMLCSGGGAVLIALTLIQIAPIKIDPWSTLAMALGRCINADLSQKIDEVALRQVESKEMLDKHIASDAARTADQLRARVLQFNNELLRNIPHTREEFIEILSIIDSYRQYCRDHPEYPNSRAVHAIANIERVYDERMEKRDFL